MITNYHSFQGQDRFVVAASGGMRGGFFIDSGASDGVWGSNTYALERDLGWRGICIEPNDDLFARLRASRSCTCLNVCLYDRTGEVSFLEAAEVYGGIVAEYEPSHRQFAEAFVKNKGEAVVSSAKAARTIRDILREHAARPVVDYWSLDTEGSELAILQTFPFDEYRVRFLTVEHNHAPVRGKIAALLAGHGYARVADLGIDDAYAWTGNGTGAWRSRALKKRR